MPYADRLAAFAIAVTVGRQAFTVALSVNGDVWHGAIDKLSLVETRAITVDTLPYVNVSGWTVETLK
jgi:hypothetical protein